MEIKVITYEQSRLKYFKEMRKSQIAKYEKLKRSKGFKELPSTEQHRLLSYIGEKISYFDDVVKMLEENVKFDRKECEGV